MSENKGFIDLIASGGFTGALSSANNNRGKVGFFAGVALGYQQGGFWGAVKYGVAGFLAAKVSEMLFNVDRVDGMLGQNETTTVAKTETPAVEDKTQNEVKAQNEVKDIEVCPKAVADVREATGNPDLVKADDIQRSSDGGVPPKDNTIQVGA